MLEIVLFCVLITLSCLAQGVIGFRSTLFATPFALLFLDKETVVSSMLLVGVAVNILLVKKIHVRVDKKVIFPLFLTSLLGMPFGLLVLQSVSAEVMKIIVGILSVFFLALLMLKRIKLSSSNWLVAISGFLSGVLTTSTSMNGPPVVLLLAGQTTSKDSFRKTLVVFFLLMGIVALGLFLGNGLLDTRRLSFGLFAIPFALLGGYLGNKIAKRVSQKLFRILVFGCVFLSAIYGIYGGITSLH